MTNVLRDDDYRKILKNRFKDVNVKFLQAEIKPISENAEGFMGEHYQVIITYKRNGTKFTEPFFMKTIPKNDKQASFSKTLYAYEKEIFQYEILHKEFKKYGYDTSFATESFYSIPNETIIMHDLTKLGYQIPERLKCYDLDHLKCLLKSLALYHGAGFAFERTKSKELGHCFTLEQEWPLYFKETLYKDLSSTIKEMWDGYIQTYNKLIDFLPETESYRKEFQDLLREYNMLEAFTKKTNLAKTCGHGDLWSNNMMFKYVNNIPVTCCLVDFQICRYSYPSYDVLISIYTNTSSEFRAKYLPEMYQYYYDILSEIVQNYGYSLQDIMPISDFYDSMELVKVNAMIHILLTLCIIYLPKTTLTSIKQNENADSVVLNKDNKFTYINAFQIDEKFRKAVSDGLYDLREALLQHH